MYAKLSIPEIHCVDEADGPGKAEPYLWPLYFKVDGPTLAYLAKEAGEDDIKSRVKNLLSGSDDTIDQWTTMIVPDIINQANDSVQWYHAPDGSHGNLGDKMDAGDTRTVPDDISHWESSLEGLTLLGQDALKPGDAKVGIVAALLEEDSIPDRYIPDSYNDFRDQVIAKITEQALGELAAGLADAIAGMEDSIQRISSSNGGGSGSDSSQAEELADSLKDGFEEDTPWYINRDEVIGGIVENWTADELVQNEYSGTTVLAPPMSEDGKYRVSIEASAWANLGAPAITAWSHGSRPPLSGARDIEGANSLPLFRWRDASGILPDLGNLGSTFGIDVPLGRWLARNDTGDLADGTLSDRKPVLWTWNVDNTEHVCAELVDGDENHLVELWRPYGRSWRRAGGIEQLSKQDRPNAPACAWTWGHDSTQHVAYRSGTALVELWFKRGNGWRRGSGLTSATNGTDPKSMAPAPFTLSRSQHVLYIGGNDHVYEAWFQRGQGWRVRDLSADQGVITNAESLAATAAPGQPGILVVRDDQGALHDYTLSSPGGNWSPGTLNQTIPAGTVGIPSVAYGRRRQFGQYEPWICVRKNSNEFLATTQSGNSWNPVGLPSHPDADSDPQIASWEDKIFIVFAVAGHGRIGSLVLSGNDEEFIGGKH